VDGEHIRAAARISERERDHHLAAHRGIGRLELHHFDHPLIGYELDEVAVVGVGVRGRLAGPGRLVVRERDFEQTTFASVEHMHVARHANRHHPCRDRSRVEKRAVDICARRVHATPGARRGRSQTLNLPQRDVTPWLGDVITGILDFFVHDRGWLQGPSCAPSIVWDHTGQAVADLFVELL
jgi:hypothetical protein